jgi:hypothetical protein
MSRMTRSLTIIPIAVTLGWALQYPRAPRLVSALPEATPVTRIIFASRLKGWFTAGPRLWWTEDGGAFWTEETTPKLASQMARGIDGIQALDASVTILIQNRLFQSNDHTGRWSENPGVPIGNFGGEVLGVEFAPGGRDGWAFGGVYRKASDSEDGPNNAIRIGRDGQRLILEPVLFRTGDSGQRWSRQDPPSTPDAPAGFRITGVSVAGEGHAVATSESAVFYMDGRGAEWRMGRFYEPGCARERSFEDERDRIRLVYLLDARLGWASVDDGSLYRTTDGGRTWCESLQPGSIRARLSTVPTFFDSIGFISPKVGWATEVSGTLFQTVDGGSSWKSIPSGESRFQQIAIWHREMAWALANDGVYRLEIP